MPKTKNSSSTYLKQSFIWPVLTIVVLVFFIIVAILFVSSRTKEYEQVVTVGNQSFTVEVADTVGERERGLSERDSMPSNKGMLFDFKQEGKWQMWMLRMRFNLDMAWLDETGKIVYIRENLTPDTFPNAFIPDTNARYVLEVNAGSLSAAGVKLGDTVRL